MPRYEIFAPISGHIRFEVDAANEEEAIDKMYEADLNLNNCVEDFEIHKRVGRGNMCEFNTPWEMQVTPIDDDE